LNQRAERSAVGAAVGAEFRSAEDRVATGEVHSASGAEASRVVGQESGLATAAADGSVAEVGWQDAVGRTFVQSGWQSCTTTGNSHGLSGSKSGNGQGSCDQSALEHEESPFQRWL